MSISHKLFGTLPDGRGVDVYTLRNASGVKVRILTYGGAIQQLYIPDRKGCFCDVLGGYDCLDSYVRGDGYQGALIGRVGNRIAKGTFTLDGKEYRMFINNGPNHLHGGEFGFNAKIFDVVATEDTDTPSLSLRYVSPDGEEKYPGTLTVTVTYTLTAENGLRIRYVATTDKKTILNLTNHSYFNLAGYATGSVLDHELYLDADTYLPTDTSLIPTGELRPVANTPFDFTVAKPIGQDIEADNADLTIAGGYDHCFNFRGGASHEPVLRATLYHRESGRKMDVYTNQPCVQVYTGNFLTNEEFPFKGNFAQRPRSFVCLETQHMPDSINHENFTDCTLSPGEVYDYTTEYRFSVE